MSYKNDNQYRVYDSRIGKIHIVRDFKIDESNQVDSDSDSDDFWTHEDDKLLNSNFEIQDSKTIISSKRLALKLKPTLNRVESFDLRIENFDQWEL